MIKEILEEYKKGGLSTREALGKLLSIEGRSIRSPLSQGQQGLWVLQKLEPEMSSYNVPLCFGISKEVEVNALKKACDFLIAQHPILRTVVVQDKGIPFQMLGAAEEAAFEWEDVSKLEAEDLLLYIKEKVKRPFILEEGPLMRVHLLSRADKENFLVIVIHHIIFDGSSVALLMNTLLAAYRVFLRGDVPAIAPILTSYGDFVELERQIISGSEGNRHRAYWMEQLSGDLPILELPTDRPRSAMMGAEARTYTSFVPAELGGRLKKLAQACHVSVPVIFLSIYKILLHQYTGQEDIIVGMPTIGRPQSRFDSVIGFFVGMIALRSAVKEEQPLLEFIQSVQLTLVDGLDHSSYPFPALVRDLNVPRVQGSPPVFQVAFAYQNMDGLGEAAQGTLPLSPMEGIHQEGAYELELEIWEAGEGFRLNAKYTVGLFDPSTIGGMVGHYLKLLEELVEVPDARVGDFSLLTQQESKALMDWNATQADYPKTQCVHDLFTAQASQTPDAVAVIYEGRSLTYRELDDRSNALAYELERVGVSRGHLVGICVERSLEMVVGLLGILKAGAAYVPLDLDYPQERLAYMIADSGTKLVLTQSKLMDKVLPLLGEDIKAFSVDGKSDKYETTYTVSSDSAPIANSEDLAYVMYTSGSTGKPKGVMISHRALVNFLWSMSRNPGLTSEDKLLAVTTYSFDIAGLELYLPLINGAQCHICSAAKAKDAEKLRREIEAVKPTMMQATPVTWSMLFQIGWKNKEQVKILCGGEALPPKLAQLFIETGAEVWNMYGPTETTIWSTIERLGVEANVGLGKPIANTEIYILDRNVKPVPALVAGELCIAGDGLAKGYLNQSELTEEKFVNHPFVPGAKLYKTGDLARWRFDGTIEYLGRIDSQVKIRGFRIELGEIESRLNAYEKIENCAVVAAEREGVKHLVAYCVQKRINGVMAPLDIRQLRTHLKGVLPDHMIPSKFVEIDTLPLTPNGKINRQTLTRLAASAAPQQVSASTKVETAGQSGSGIRQKILEIWQEILGTKDIDIEEGFFDVGGDSILAIVMAERLKSQFNCSFDVTALFKYANIKNISNYIAEQGIKISDSHAMLEVMEPHPVRVTKVTGMSDDDAIQHPEYYKDSVAIIGLSCQLPGAEDHYEFWNNLKQGKESIQFLSKEALLNAGLTEALISNPKYVPVRSALEGKDLFDPEFFNFSARDAENMDPQLRLLLLHSWKAIEDGGYAPKAIPSTSVFMSASNNFYQASSLFGSGSHESRGAVESKGYASWLLAQSGTISTIISHKLDLRGGSFFLHSNCSSSLSGLFSACQSIVSGQSKHALVGAATLHAWQQNGYVYQEGMNFSRDGHLRAFDAEADGMVSGEGVAVILLKNLIDAIEDGDHIYAIVRGVAVNNDGSEKAGFYAPSVRGQSEVIQKALDITNVDPATISYIEAHGTGTKLGDPIEFAALHDAYKRYTDKKQFCGIGSVKTNIGHLDTAAGLAGCIKVALSLAYGQIPPSLNYKAPNPNISLEHSPFYVVDKLKTWDENPAPLRAALSSFGIGGTNAHAIFEQAPHVDVREAFTHDSYLILLSAKNQDRLKDQVLNLLDFLKVRRHVDLADMAYTLQVGREAMEERLAVMAGSVEELKDKLQAVLAGEEGIEQVYRGQVKRNKDALGVFAADEDMAKAIEAWVAKGKYGKLLDLWVKGLVFDWDQLYGEHKPRRMSLPTYPFARERYWVPVGAPPAQSNLALANAPKQEDAPSRERYFLKKSWEICAQLPSHRANQRLAILATQETKDLASRLANAFPESRIFVGDEFGEPNQELERRWQDYDGWVDLVGCGSIEDDAPDWIVMLQQWVELRRKEGGIALCVTRGLETYGNADDINLSGASRVGLYRMLQSEYSRLRSRHVDVENSIDDAVLVEQICSEFFLDDTEVEICYRGGNRYRSYLKEEQKESLPVPSHKNQARNFPEGHVLWITGGTRGIGYVCAQHFIKNYGVKNVVLTGRDVMPPREQWEAYQEQNHIAGKIRNILALESLGAQVRVLSVALTDASAVQQSIRTIKNSMGPIGGVIHAAGLMDSENPAFIRKPLEAISRVLAPKKAGLDVLIECFKQEPLQFFALFSSVSAVIPALGAGQSDYAMANAYMDYVAHAQAGICPVISIQWPNWKEAGMGEAKSPAYQKTGFLPHTNKEGLDLLDDVLSAKLGPVVMPVIANPELWKPQGLMRFNIQLETASRSQPKLRTVGDISSASLLVKAVQKWLVSLLADALKVEASKLEVEGTFTDYGADSVLLIQLLREISQIIEADLDPSILFEYPTIEAFAKWLSKTYPAFLSKVLDPPFSEQPVSEAIVAPLPLEETIAEDTAHANDGVSQLLPQRQKDLEQSATDIAVVGLSCRFPGAANLEQYWQLLSEGRSAISPVPKERWGYSTNYYAGLLDNITQFDPKFFLMSESDARAMDPQALLVLEETLNLWCHAGYSLQEIKGKPIGVYLGGRSHHRPDEHAFREAKNPVMAVGQNYLAANLSQFFDLRGPSLVLDTACSSALVGMNMAIQSLRAGEITSAVVGGVSLLQTDAALRIFRQRDILNNEFHIFDQRSHGAVLGEGVGLVLLKTVDQALRDGDHIYATIKALAVNNDGRTAGPVAPSFQAQKEVMQNALIKSGKNPEEIAYIEVNGSGSEVTDLLELKAIESIYRSLSTAPCSLGSMKPNIGHPLCAEGIASFIKVVLMLHHRQHVPFLSGQQPMKHYDIEASPFYFCKMSAPWDKNMRTAAINCFADGGTNAHVILEGWEQPDSASIRRHPIAPPALERINVRSLEPRAAPQTPINILQISQQTRPYEPQPGSELQTEISEGSDNLWEWHKADFL